METDKAYKAIIAKHAAELATLRAENERLREIVQGAVSLLDDLFQRGDYAPGVTLFCEKVKETLK